MTTALVDSTISKNDVIQGAGEELRISGLTVQLTPSQELASLNRLESMMAELFNGRNFDVGYNFEDVPDLNSQTYVERTHEPFMRTNLAVRMIPFFNKQVPPELKQLASASWSSSLAVVKSQQIQQIQAPRRMPRGSGNTYKQLFYNRFFVPDPLPPTMAGNESLFEGETNDFFQDYSAWLRGNTISSFTITVDPRLTLDSSSNADPRIDYRITANTQTSDGTWQLVKITVTDSAGRTEIRLVSFEVTKPPDVPSP